MPVAVGHLARDPPGAARLRLNYALTAARAQRVKIHLRAGHGIGTNARRLAPPASDPAR
jgi:hypothetical protein